MPNKSSKNPKSPKRADFPRTKAGTAAHRHAYYLANRPKWLTSYCPASAANRKIKTRRKRIENAEDVELEGDWSMPVKTTADFMAMPPEKAAKFIGEVIRKEARLV